MTLHRIITFLMYYATLKVRKFESFFYKINTFLEKITTYIGFQAEQIFYVYIIYMFFNFGSGFCGSASMLFPKAPTSCGKQIWK